MKFFLRAQLQAWAQFPTYLVGSDDNTQQQGSPRIVLGEKTYCLGEVVIGFCDCDKDVKFGRRVDRTLPGTF